jgi:hypothetical protein
MVKKCAFREHDCKGNISNTTVFHKPNLLIIIRGKDGVLRSHSSSDFAEEFLCRNCSRSQTALRKEYSLSQAEAEALQTRSGARLVSLPPAPANKRSRNETEFLVQGQGQNCSGTLPSKRKKTASHAESATVQPKLAHIEHAYDGSDAGNVERGVSQFEKDKSADDILNPIEPAYTFTSTGRATKPNASLSPVEKDKKLKTLANHLKRERKRLEREKECNKNLKEDIAQLKVCIYIIINIHAHIHACMHAYVCEHVHQ